MVLLFAVLTFGSEVGVQTPAPTPTPHPAEPEPPTEAISGASSSPSAPTGLYGKGRHQSVILIWKDVPGATGYEVMQ